MKTCQHEATTAALDLPGIFQDLDGLLRADLEAIVGMLTERAREQLFLTDRQQRRLKDRLWTELSGAIHTVLEPLSPELR